MWRGGRVTRASSSLGSNLANNASARKNGNVVGVVAGVHFRRGKTNPEKAASLGNGSFRQRFVWLLRANHSQDMGHESGSLTRGSTVYFNSGLFYNLKSFQVILHTRVKTWIRWRQNSRFLSKSLIFIPSRSSMAGFLDFSRFERDDRVMHAARRDTSWVCYFETIFTMFFLLFTCYKCVSQTMGGASSRSLSAVVQRANLKAGIIQSDARPHSRRECARVARQRHTSRAASRRERERANERRRGAPPPSREGGGGEAVAAACERRRHARRMRRRMRHAACHTCLSVSEKNHAVTPSPSRLSPRRSPREGRSPARRARRAPPSGGTNRRARFPGTRAPRPAWACSPSWPAGT